MKKFLLSGATVALITISCAALGQSTTYSCKQFKSVDKYTICNFTDQPVSLFTGLGGTLPKSSPLGAPGAFVATVAASQGMTANAAQVSAPADAKTIYVRVGAQQFYNVTSPASGCGYYVYKTGDSRLPYKMGQMSNDGKCRIQSLRLSPCVKPGHTASAANAEALQAVGQLKGQSGSTTVVNQKGWFRVVDASGNNSATIASSINVSGDKWPYSSAVVTGPLTAGQDSSGVLNKWAGMCSYKVTVTYKQPPNCNNCGHRSADYQLIEIPGTADGSNN